GDDWKTVAKANGVNVATARSYLCRDDLTYKKRGGYRACKLSEAHLDVVQNWVESECQLTLAEITARIANEINVSVSIPTVHRALDGRAYTYKDVHPEPLQMNTDLAKENRRHYVPIWVDETNFNLFTARRKGRAKRNTRAVVPRNAPQKGKNLHVIGAMTLQGFYYMEHMR
ncbi:hypothetical protein ACHHYP_16506, partial [Achlya hypogyna]